MAAYDVSISHGYTPNANALSCPGYISYSPGFGLACLEIRIPNCATKNKAIYPPIDLYLAYLCVHLPPRVLVECAGLN